MSLWIAYIYIYANTHTFNEKAAFSDGDSFYCLMVG